MKLYVLRHGTTDGNQKEMLQGNLDIPLNDFGKSQAIARREEIAKLNIDQIFCSPKLRTKETAELAAPGIPISFDDRLLSRDHGEFQGLTRGEVDLDSYWNMNLNCQYERAESVTHIYNRVAEFLRELKAKYPDQSILIVTHSAIIRCIYYYFNEIPEDGSLLPYESRTASLEAYEY